MSELVDKLKTNGIYFLQRQTPLEILNICLTHPDLINQYIDLYELLLCYAESDELFSILFTHPYYSSKYFNVKSLRIAVDLLLPKLYKKLSEQLTETLDFFKFWSFEDYTENQQIMDELGEYANQSFHKFMIDFLQSCVIEILNEDDFIKLEYICDFHPNVIIEYINSEQYVELLFTLKLFELTKDLSYHNELNFRRIFIINLNDAIIEGDTKQEKYTYVVQILDAINHTLYNGKNSLINGFTANFEKENFDPHLLELAESCLDEAPPV